MKSFAAVIDIGMTNKKICVYDANAQLVASVKRSFAPRMTGGLETHDLDAMEAWFVTELRSLAAQYDIGALSFSTHGATLVCLGADERPVLPCIYYTHEPGADFHVRFYNEMGTPESLQAVTGTPNFSALINPAKGLFFAREKFPREYACIKKIVSYPQYWGLRFTGRAGAEGTYTGCHTYLWDWKRGVYSSVAQKLGAADKLQMPIRNSWDVLGTLSSGMAQATGLSRDTLVTMGIHDSNASLLPYLIYNIDERFVLNSTGSWCVAMNPAAEYGFADDELGKVVFFNRSAYNRPVKTAIFTGGLEYEAWLTLIQAARQKNTASACASSDVYARLFREKNFFIFPELIQGSGQFPHSSARAVIRGKEYSFDALRAAPHCLEHPDTALAALNVSLAIQTLSALKRTGLQSGASVYTEGGFRNNADYNALLATALPENKLYLSDMPEASSMGAALCAIAAMIKKNPDELRACFAIEKKAVACGQGFEGLHSYMAAWLSAVEEGGPET